MSVLDITKDVIVVDQIKWCGDSDFNLVRCSDFTEVSIHREGVDCLHGGSALLADAEEAENLIKALQKAIDLGWFN
jgi:hypothetical protein